MVPAMLMEIALLMAALVKSAVQALKSLFSAPVNGKIVMIHRHTMSLVRVLIASANGSTALFSDEDESF